MSRRTMAGIIAVPLLIVLWGIAAFVPLPYVTYSPGLTVDVNAETKQQEIIQVSGHRAYQQAGTGPGELLMTTVYVTSPGGRVNLFETMAAWLDDERAVYPRDAVYPEGTTEEDADTESAVDMVTSQDAAVASALREMGRKVSPVVEVVNVSKGMPATKVLQVRDVIVRMDGAPIRDNDDLLKALEKLEVGEPTTFELRRDGKTITRDITPVESEGEPRFGFVPGTGYDLPFDVRVNIPDNIGGPSAGLMFSLGIYDALTPGSLAGGKVIAGTGTIDDRGRVGPIGGIAQKVVAARDQGAELFLVPKDNCASALQAPNGDVRLVRATTMHEARAAIETWTKDPEAALPSCEEE